MWPFRRKIVVAPLDQQEAVLALTKEISALKVAVTVLRDEFQALDERYEKLRGRFYNTQRGKAADRDPNDTTQMSREELKRHMALSGRFVPGKPAVHD